jgi:hypothetical protein
MSHINEKPWSANIEKDYLMICLGCFKKKRLLRKSLRVSCIY